MAPTIRHHVGGLILLGLCMVSLQAPLCSADISTRTRGEIIVSVRVPRFYFPSIDLSALTDRFPILNTFLTGLSILPTGLSSRLLDLPAHPDLPSLPLPQIPTVLPSLPLPSIPFSPQIPTALPSFPLPQPPTSPLINLPQLPTVPLSSPLSDIPLSPSPTLPHPPETPVVPTPAPLASLPVFRCITEGIVYYSKGLAALENWRRTKGCHDSPSPPPPPPPPPAPPPPPLPPSPMDFSEFQIWSMGYPGGIRALNLRRKAAKRGPITEPSFPTPRLIPSTRVQQLNLLYQTYLAEVANTTPAPAPATTSDVPSAFFPLTRRHLLNAANSIPTPSTTNFNQAPGGRKTAQFSARIPRRRFNP